MTPPPIPAKARSTESLRMAAALLCAGGSTWLYRILIRVLPRLTSAEPTGAGEVFPWVKPLTHASLQSIQHHTHGVAYTVEFMACCAGLFLLYGVMLRMAKGAQPRWFTAFSFAAPAVFMGVLLCAPAMLSSDVYAYAYYGRLLSVYGANAHAAAPSASLADSILLNGYFQFVPSVYGPLWTLISAGVTWGAGSHIGLTLALFRVLEIMAILAGGVLIWRVMRRLAPERVGQAVVLFLWNPLVVIESGLGGHNDACMMALALLAVWLHLRGYKVSAVVVLTLSALVKVITGPLVPLYMLMVLRRTAGWKERGAFLIRAGLGAGAAVIFFAALARESPNGIWVSTASSAAFYENNYHELLFKGLRGLLGEPADSLEAPMDFHSWWVATNSAAMLHDGTSNKSRDLCRLKPGQKLLVVSDEDSETWLRVYDPADRKQGYVEWLYVKVIPAPADAESDPTVRRLSGWPAEWPTVVTANRWIRLVTWGAFVALGLAAAWKTTDLDRFLVWANVFFLASQLLVFTRIWPWYMVWPLAFGALKPGHPGTRLAIWLSAGMLPMYALFDYTGTEWDWLYEYRSIPTIVLPVALFAAWRVWGRMREGNFLAQSSQRRKGGLALS